jgi:hypothetical protein
MAIINVRNPDQSQKVLLIFPKNTPREKIHISATTIALIKGDEGSACNCSAKNKGKRMIRDSSNGANPLTRATSIGRYRLACP